MAVEQRAQSLNSAVTSLKQIATIVTGVTATNGIIVLLTAGQYTAIRSLSNVPRDSMFLFLILITNIIRFYHGNIRLLDDFYGSDTNLPRDGRNLGVDFFVVFIQCIAFAAMSFYLDHADEFFAIYIGLLVIDIIWFTLSRSRAEDNAEFKRQRNWTLNNVGAVVAMLLCTIALGPAGPDVYFVARVVIVCLNTVIDYIISWKFYFPFP
jgi:hypothetical protein